MHVCICVYIYLNHFAVHLKLTQCCKSTKLQLKINKSMKASQAIPTQSRLSIPESGGVTTCL